MINNIQCLTLLICTRTTTFNNDFWINNIMNPNYPGTCFSFIIRSLLGRHIDRDGVSNHQPHDCLFNRLFRRRSMKTSKLCVTGLSEGNSPVTGEFPAQRTSNAENVSFWWRHQDMFLSLLDHVTAMGYPPFFVRHFHIKLLKWKSYILFQWKFHSILFPKVNSSLVNCLVQYRRQAIIWIIYSLYIDAYMRHSALMI